MNRPKYLIVKKWKDKGLIVISTHRTLLCSSCGKELGNNFNALFLFGNSNPQVGRPVTGLLTHKSYGCDTFKEYSWYDCTREDVIISKDLYFNLLHLVKEK